MTQFQPPPVVPGSPPLGPPGTYQPPRGEPAWSVAAVTGFVLSLLGCAGITAVAGFILGIVGIVRTMNGQRRGRGLAIAAIPTSLATGAFSFVVAVLLVNVTQFIAQVPAVFSADVSGDAAAVTVMRNVGSNAFISDVDAEQINRWFGSIRAKHGKIVEFGPPRSESGAGGDMALVYDIKCVNGPARLRVTMRMDGLQFKLDDISIDDVSPRDVD